MYVLGLPANIIYDKIILQQEAFKAVEDVYGLMQLSKRSPKPQVMANYYQKVALVFWKAENYLFHAATLHRLYVLSKEQRRTMTAEENQKWVLRVWCKNVWN